MKKINVMRDLTDSNGGKVIISKEKDCKTKNIDRIELLIREGESPTLVIHTSRSNVEKRGDSVVYQTISEQSKISDFDFFINFDMEE